MPAGCVHARGQTPCRLIEPFGRPRQKCFHSGDIRRMLRALTLEGPPRFGTDQRLRRAMRSVNAYENSAMLRDTVSAVLNAVGLDYRVAFL